ncbi:SPOR domain-containing protein [Novosphingobium sp. 9]|uniref:SPOR domain-containing protein n=1 Tax=Novosphingobium sp. 9 TaxID=2025349 RepID=UPI0021B63AAB|nr:SPOR domain-containing protein [Novosphingobium sp. 9]
MDRSDLHARRGGFALASAMAAVLVAGCTGQTHVASAGAPVGQSATEKGAKGLETAESRVAKAPRDAGARAALAQAYLDAGRFESAAQTFDDARSLGDKSASIALGSVLAYIGAGRQEDALRVLSESSQVIPVSDYGLALALAGRPDQAVNILTDAVRGGQASARMRQNLAYAYALSGNWGAAHVIASQDLTQDQADARLGEWSRESAPENYRLRVAGLLRAPMVSDPGQPEALALNGPKADAPRMAKADPAPTPAGELPAVGDAAMPLAEANPVPPAPVEARPMQAAVTPMSAPQAAPAPMRMAAYVAPVPEAVRRAPVRPATRPVAAESFRTAFAEQGTIAPRGNHLIQLGSFRTLDAAKRSWATFVARNPRLKGHQMRITQADVNGQRFYRVSAEGFDAGSARTMCSVVKGRGAGCFAYAESKPLPGAVRRSAAAPKSGADTRFAVNDPHSGR